MVVRNRPDQCAALVATVFAVDLKLRRTFVPKQMKAICATDPSRKTQTLVNGHRFFEILLRGWRMHPYFVERMCKDIVESVEENSRSVFVDFAAVVHRRKFAAASKHAKDAQYFDL